MQKKKSVSPKRPPQTINIIYSNNQINQINDNKDYKNVKNDNIEKKVLNKKETRQLS